MERTYVSVTFQDESGKTGLIRVNDARKDLDAPTVKTAAQTVVDAGVFRAKGKFTVAKKADLVTVSSTQLFTE